MKQLLGIHHVTAITSSAKEIYKFYTNILGLRLVKKNVNQDDLSTYHLFFADDKGSAGTDMTFFDFKNIPQRSEGKNEIATTSFRVNDDKSIEYWKKRFDHYNINYQEEILFDAKVLYFEDFDKQRYALVSDENNTGIKAGEPWKLGPVPNEFAILGFGPIFLSVENVGHMRQALEDIFKMTYIKEENDLHLFEMGTGGHGAQVIVKEVNNLPYARQGYGGVHHVAFRVTDTKHLNEWEDHFNNLKLRNSGYVNRFYFESLYISIYPNILFELATDGPGFIDDEESYEILGEKLTLPPHLREYREYIETQLENFDTVRSNKVFAKEYF